MDNMLTDGFLGEARELLAFALEEFEQAKREHSEVRARQVCEKAYLAMTKAFNALFVAKGKKPEELPKTDRGRSHFIITLAGRDLRGIYGQLRSNLHLDGFHDGLIHFDSIESDLSQLQDLIERVEQIGPSPKR